jgi:hypothetical protein
MTWYQSDVNGGSGTYMGRTRQNNLTDQPSNVTNADAQIIDIGANQVTNANMTHTSTNWQAVTAVEGQDQDAIGWTVCLSGRNGGDPNYPGYDTSYICGVLNYKLFSYTQGNTWVQYQRQVTGVHSVYGDSGAAVFEQSGKAVGTGVRMCDGSPGCSGTWFSYSHIYDVQNQLNVSVVTTPGPGAVSPNAKAAVVGGLSNSLSIYVNAVDQTVQRVTGDPATGTWETVGGSAPPSGAAHNPAALRDAGTAREDVFVAGNDGHLYHNWNPSGAIGGWSSVWEQLPGPTITGDPSAINEGISGVVEVFARDSSGYLYQWRQQGSGWGLHEYLNGAQIQNDPVAQSWGVPGFHVFWRGTDNNLWEAYNSASYPADVIATGFYGGDPASTLNPNGDWENVFYRGANGHLWSASCCQGGWTTGDRGGSVDPNMAISASGWINSINTWFAGANGNVQSISCCSPGWSATFDSGQPTAHTSSPVGVPWPNRYEVIYRNPNSDNWVSDYTCCPSGNWSPLTIKAPNIPTAPRW